MSLRLFGCLLLLCLFIVFAPLLCFADVTDGDPYCWPGDANSSIQTFTQDTIVQSFAFKGAAGAVAWFCDVDHTWVRQGWVWQAAEATTQRYLTIKALLLNPSKNQMIALWRGNIVGSIYDANSPDADLIPLFESIQPPAYAPPSGSIMKTNIVYAQKFQTDAGYKMQAVGSVTKVPFASVVCNYAEKLVDNGKTYYAIPRSAVTMKKIGNYTPPFPNTAYGECT